MSVARRVIIVAVGAIAIVLVLGAIALIPGQSAPAPAPSPSPQPVEQTLLLQVLDADGYAVGNAVIGVEPPEREPRTVVLAVPSSLLVDEGDDSVSLGVVGESGPQASLDAVESALGVRLDAGIAFDRLAFAGLVDAVDGVWVQLDRPILVPAIADEGRLRVLGPGWVKMDGLAAADYAVLRVPGESEEDRIDRFLSVLQDVLERLPRTDDQLRQLLTSLGSLAATTVPSDELVPFLKAVRADIAVGRLRVDTLPVQIIRGGARPASVPAPEAEPLVQQLFPDARITPGEAGMTG